MIKFCSLLIILVVLLLYSSVHWPSCIYWSTSVLSLFFYHCYYIDPSTVRSVSHVNLRPFIKLCPLIIIIILFVCPLLGTFNPALSPFTESSLEENIIRVWSPIGLTELTPRNTSYITEHVPWSTSDITKHTPCSTSGVTEHTPGSSIGKIVQYLWSISAVRKNL